MAFVCLQCGSQYNQHTRFCAACFSLDRVILAPIPRRTAIDAEAEVASSRDLVQRSWSLVDVSSVAPGLRLQRGSLLCVTGPPGAGKSTLGMALADVSDLPVVWFSAEERLGASVAQRLDRLGIRRDDFVVVGRSSIDDLIDLVRKVNAGVLAIDSVQVTNLAPDDLRALVYKLDLHSLIVVSQVTKEGTMRGSRALEHEADVVMSVEAGTWKLTKTRYQATGLTGEVPFHGRQRLEGPDEGTDVSIREHGRAVLRALPTKQRNPTD